MNGYLHEQVAFERRKEEMAAAEQYHWARQAELARPHQPGVYQRLLNGLGERMVVWGCAMQSYAARLAPANGLEDDPCPCR